LSFFSNSLLPLIYLTYGISWRNKKASAAMRLGRKEKEEGERKEKKRRR